MTHNWNTYSTCGTAMISVVTLCFTLILNIIRCQIFLSPGAILQCVPNIQGRRNHFLAGDIERLSIMLLGNSLDTSRYPMRTLCQALFPDDCAEEGSNHDQVCTVHHLYRASNGVKHRLHMCTPLDHWSHKVHKCGVLHLKGSEPEWPNQQMLS